MKSIFDSSSYECSKLITERYSTSFSSSVRMLEPSLRDPIYAIYGFVRYADEIVDTFHEYNQEELINEFEQNYFKALDRKISLNPILNAFQEVVHQYDLFDLVTPFMKSMKMDLDKSNYLTQKEYEEYIYGSADVVGLMCLKIFVKGDEKEYHRLKESAQKLGSAFQKVNFLRDLRDDIETLGRFYFPGINLKELNQNQKEQIIEEIEHDFANAYIGIKQLPDGARFGVLAAYKFYLGLLKKLKKTHASDILSTRIRVSDSGKMFILGKSYIRHQLNIL